MLRLTIPGGINPPSTPTDGNAALVDLSPYPRLRLQLTGNNIQTVSIHVYHRAGNFGEHQVWLDGSQLVLVKFK